MRRINLNTELNRIERNFVPDTYYLGVYLLEAIPCEIAEKCKELKSLEPARVFVAGLQQTQPPVQTAQTEQQNNITIYTFGVEIECLMNTRQFIETCNNNNVELRNDMGNYNHIDSNTSFKIVRDGSIRAQRGLNGAECVSPILNSFDKLKNVCDCLAEVGAEVNKSCGLHVHIGANNFTPIQYLNIFVNYMYLEPIIDASLAFSRRANNNYYAKTLYRRLAALDEIRLGINDNLQNIAYTIEDVFCNDRYYKVNACSFARHKTIEFRQHQGSVEYGKISQWVKFLLNLCEWSKNHRLTSDVFEKNDARLEGLDTTLLRVMPN